MVALLRFFEAGEVLGQLLLRKERRAVNALELRILFVALPVGAGDGKQLERLDFRRAGDVRAAAEIDEGGAERVLGKNLAGFFADQLALHPEVLVTFQALGLRRHDALVRKIARLDVPHALLDFFEVFGSERILPLEVVIEAGLGGRPDAQLGFGKQLEHGEGKQMGRRMAIDFQRFGIAGGEDFQFRVAFERAGQIPKFAVYASDDRIGRQARADFGSDVDGARAAGRGLVAAVGQGDVQAVDHGVNFQPNKRRRKRRGRGALEWSSGASGRLYFSIGTAA